MNEGTTVKIVEQKLVGISPDEKSEKTNGDWFQSVQRPAFKRTIKLKQRTGNTSATELSIIIIVFSVIIVVMIITISLKFVHKVTPYSMNLRHTGHEKLHFQEIDISCEC